MKESNGNHRLTSIDVIESVEEEASAFYDTSNPTFASPTRVDQKKHRTWKRKLALLIFVLLLVGCGVAALYLLLRVNRVNVKVEANSNRETSKNRAAASSQSAESGLSAEAINIAREALGSDTAGATPVASPNASPTASSTSDAKFQHLLTFTDNSPVYGRSPGEELQNNKSVQANSSSRPASSETEQVPLQSRANRTETLVVEDVPLKPLSFEKPSPLVIAEKSTPKIAPPVNSPVLPPFGTMLPVRTLGVIFSLRNNSFARLELSRDCKGEGWSLPKGTLLVGRVRGSEYDRAYVSIVGYIDTKTNKLVKVNGEALGSDGGAGIPGKRVMVDRHRFKQTLSKVASGGLQAAGMMAGALTGRGTVVLNGAGYRLLNPITDEAGQIVNSTNEKQSFVKIEAGESAYVMISDLPKEIRAIDAPGDQDWNSAATSLTDREVMELILFGTPDEIKAALPNMTEAQRKLANQ